MHEEVDLRSDLIGQTIGGSTICRYIDRGASAMVFEGTNTDHGSAAVAVKVFDPEFLKKYKSDVQIARINRQLQLIGKHHDNLIDILDGGKCSKTGYYFIVMPLLRGPTLEKLIGRIPPNRVRTIISQVADAAVFLEAENIYHRDIKPANIAILGEKYEKAVLLDLGVIRPLGLEEYTDSTDTRPFVGTTQYSPPEFLIRDEDITPDGYRAVTFYQLGAVLHDLLMHRPIFQDRLETYGKLVRAVLIEDPIIDNTSASADLVRLTRFCLLKDPSKRLKLVTWDLFCAAAPAGESIISLKDRMQRLRSASRDDETARPGATSLATIARDVANSLGSKLKRSCIEDRETFPPANYQTLGQVGNASSFVLTFSPYARHRLDQYLHCAFCVKATQADPRIVEIMFAAGTSFEVTDLTKDPIPFRTLVFDIHDGDGQDECLAAMCIAFVDVLEETVTGTASADETGLRWLQPEGGDS